MIIFYSKTNGEIVGTIDGRVHTEDHLKMWIGGEENDRIICNWIPGKITEEITEIDQFIQVGIDEKGQAIYKKEKVKIVNPHSEYEPEHEQKEIFKELDKTPRNIHKYKINLQTKLLAISKTI